MTLKVTNSTLVIRYLIIAFFRSPGPKGQVWFSYHLASVVVVVVRRRRPSSLTVSKVLASETTWPI